jgi:Holliday junction resolvase RusA-like endonuclease
MRGDIEVEYNLFWNDKRKRDIENYIKAISDTLVEYTVIEDDSLIRRMVVEYHKGNKETRIRIIPYFIGR